MPDVSFVSPTALRQRFASAMSDLYRTEVPLYGDLLDLVRDVNAPLLHTLTEREQQKLSQERHGAIRVGTAWELNSLARMFKILGMYPVDYYDLSVAGLPVHATAFRPIDEEALLDNPFRIFTSLLRFDLIKDPETRELAQSTLERRSIISGAVLMLIDRAEKQGGLKEADVERFIKGSLQTFKWHLMAEVNADDYQKLAKASPLCADVVSFAGPHINHLTPCTLDIDSVQNLMISRGIPPKSIIEGPPHRLCPLLLRQTSFQALSERIFFLNEETHDTTKGTHKARFGEIESRGAALTAKGRALYEDIFRLAREKEVDTVPSHVRTDSPKANEANDKHQQHLQSVFGAFPDSWDELREQDLIHVRYGVSADWKSLPAPAKNATIDDLLASGHVTFKAITYEDFLPASAAGIFGSNIGGNTVVSEGTPDQAGFEEALGFAVTSSQDLYAATTASSIQKVKEVLGL